MTVAVVVKVFDGIVLAADSATTLSIPTPRGTVHQVYNSANKVFHLHRGLPIAAMTWGLGAIESASIATLTKDLRRRLMGNDPDHLSWSLNPESYTIEEVAQRYVEMFHGELYSASFSQNGGAPPELGMLIAGYSSGEKQAEAWQVLIADPSTPPVPECLIGVPGYGFQAFAQPDATERLFQGIDSGLREAIKSSVGEPIWSNNIEPLLAQAGRLPLAAPMPIADAIEFAKFLVHTTAQYSHFLMGPDTVGGVIDVAAISRHEGFRWINRKHYYPQDLNPWGTSHDH